ncbi:hypothetical protein [Ahniella affigens]|uniref:hypothetical protein n=1 Tax=Ahniella affigens TaxID=2021234 RepID=UPI001F0C6D7C|nr:hypothetical protein [Ahniella affigens]
MAVTVDIASAPPRPKPLRLCSRKPMQSTAGRARKYVRRAIPACLIMGANVYVTYAIRVDLANIGNKEAEASIGAFRHEFPKHHTIRRRHHKDFSTSISRRTDQQVFAAILIVIKDRSRATAKKAIRAWRVQCAQQSACGARIKIGSTNPAWRADQQLPSLVAIDIPDTSHRKTKQGTASRPGDLSNQTAVQT